MIDAADEYVELTEGSVVTINKNQYIVMRGFIVIYNKNNRVLFLDGAKLKKL